MAGRIRKAGAVAYLTKGSASGQLMSAISPPLPKSSLTKTPADVLPGTMTPRDNNKAKSSILLPLF